VQLTALHLTDTLVVVRPGEVADLLTSPGDLRRWLEQEEPRLGPVSPEVGLRLADFRALREAIRSLLTAVVQGRPVPAEAVEAVNAASAAVPMHRSLDVADPLAPSAVEVGGGGSRTAEVLAAVARSAIEIVGTSERGRLRGCGAPRCGRFFLATREDRRWCSDACGNRARVARHHARQSSGTSR
jgi:predicted RNA-binding Zn ribbon-like protein